MTISYNWLSEYIPGIPAPEELSGILTAVGLEVESMESFESIPGGLKGLIVGEVLTCDQHPNADKLKITTVDTGNGAPLQIVCGASNVAAGQKVIVAPVGVTIYPTNGEPLTMKTAKIRGVESQGMICAEDETGLGTNHDGILVLPTDLAVGSSVSAYFQPYTDIIYEIGLTPNRMDAMSHFGVAKDVCAYLSYHQDKEIRATSPYPTRFEADNNSLPISVNIDNTVACQRYAGVSIRNIKVGDSPLWLKNRLQSIGLRPINNVVDVTNFILHETGQPIHAFDADAILEQKVIVKDLPAGTPFITLDGKERKLANDDLMICNPAEGMCIAGVFGGMQSGVKESTTSIFLESAWFNPVTIRRTSVRFGLRTDAASRFEKGVDISNTVNVLKRTAFLVKEVAGGEISSPIVDVYPDPKPKQQVNIKFDYLKKLSGKYYSPEATKKILSALGFEILTETPESLDVAVPYSKPDISLPADIVEEVLRIDGLDNVELSGAITIRPSVDENAAKEALREKVSGFLVGQGFNEIVTNSITNSSYFSEEQLGSAVKMINSLSVELDVLRPSMIETGLEAIVYNTNRRSSHLQLFEFGKTYQTSGLGKYSEQEHLTLYSTGALSQNWKGQIHHNDLFRAKAVAGSIAELCSLSNIVFTNSVGEPGNLKLTITADGVEIGNLIQVTAKQLQQFDLKQPVFVIDFNWLGLVAASGTRITYQETAKFPVVQRDLAIVVEKSTQYAVIEEVIAKLNIQKLKSINLFDIFEGAKLGAGKKSMALNFTFLDNEKTLTDKEVESMMSRLTGALEKSLGAEVRKS
ncbi:phenylalanine--tRNA ligase subunit beta [Segetibacter sp. 3557_3]|uniref:phenylalanine--tRNA ligase subunit beta n=1 Tax=Segetibacter sp. 3557_3 TaxID=2547429 RepID=UPI001058B5C5|nr:phenylalanine--tRNA ligase subunit beta [Segetibacter sp. 3557_3]TDH19810.1 phenylalanine--tRNA ligase subunit beta [Segetibacter sp. 3557_3]